MKNFNLRLGTSFPQRHLDVLCQPIVRHGKKHICIDFDSENASDAEMFLELRKLIQQRGYEENFWQKGSCYRIETILQRFDRLVLFLQASGFVCRDNYGRKIELAKLMEAVNAGRD